jgi:acyl-CoA thioesterase-1
LAATTNLSGILQVADARGLPVLLVGLEAPSNYGAEYKAAFDAIYRELAEEFGALYHENFLGALLDGNDRQTALTELMQSDAVHPNAAGVALIIADIGPQVMELVSLARIRE